MKKYQIGDKAFVQKKLVMGQVEELVGLIGNVSFSEADLNPVGIVAAIGPKIYGCLAIVLREEGKEKWWERDLGDLAEWIKWEADPEVIVEIVQDFFGLNPLSSLFEKMGGAMETLRQKFREARGSLTGSASGSPEGTSPSGT